MSALLERGPEEDDEGFTLIELLVVVMVIGILSLIAIPTFVNQRTKAVDRSMQADLHSVATSIETYLITSGTYPTTVTSSGTTVTIGPDMQVITSGSGVAAYRRNAMGTAFCLQLTRAPGEQPASQDWVYISSLGGLQAATAACPAAGAF